MFELRVFGGLDLRDARENRPVLSVTAQTKRAALLAYLCLEIHAGPARRDTLLGLFWPEAPDRRARHALSQTLYVLRATLGADAVRNDGMELLSVDGDLVWCDAVAFEDAIEAGEPERALDLYRGPLLKGVFLSDAPAFEEWLAEERRRLERLAIQAGLELSERQARVGSLVEAVAAARRAVGIAPLEEASVQRLMILLQRSGDRAAALREFDLLQERLATELDIAPSQATRALRDSLLKGRPLEGPPVAVSAEPTEAARRPDPLEIANVEGGGTERASPRPSRWRTASWALVAGVATLVVGAGVILRGKGGGPADVGAPQVLVTVFQDRTSDTSFAALGHVAADRVARALSRTGRLRVWTPVTAFRIERLNQERQPLAGARSWLPASAGEASGGWVVGGAYDLHRDSIRLRAWVVDAASGEIVRSLDPLAAPAERPLEALDELGEGVLVALSASSDERLKGWAGGATLTSSYKAYAEFVQGLRAHFSIGDAHAHYRRAMALDSSWALPMVWGLWTAPPEEFDGLLRRLEERRDALGPFEAALLDYHAAWGRQDMPAMYDAASRLVELAPDSEFLWKKASVALRLGRVEEAARVLARADPDRGWLDGWVAYWGLSRKIAHQRGRHDEELELARRARERFPDHRRLTAWEALALVDLGRGDEALAVLEPLFGLPPSRVPADELVRVSARAAWTGQDGIASTVASRALSLYEGLSPSEMGVNNLIELTREWALRGRTERSSATLAYMEELVASIGLPDHPLSLRSSGVVAAIEGRLEDARRYDEALAAWDERGAGGWQVNYNSATALMGRVVIAAHLGEVDRAVRLLQRYRVSGGDPWNPSDPALRPLWDHAEYRRMAGL